MSGRPENQNSEPGENAVRDATNVLAARAQQGDRASFDEAYQRCAPALYAWARLRVREGLRSRFDPEDVVQEVTLRALESFATWDPVKGGFRGWLFGIARHVLRRALERIAFEAPAAGGSRTRETTLASLPANTTAITRAVARNERLQRFVAILETLPDDDRRLLTLRGLEGLPHEHVATLLEISADTAAKRWQRLRDRLSAEPDWLDIVAA